MFPLAQCHGTGNHVTASDWDGGEPNSGSPAWKSLMGKMLLSFECSVEKGGSVNLGSELLLCLTTHSPSASIKVYLQPSTFLHCPVWCWLGNLRRAFNYHVHN